MAPFKLKFRMGSSRSTSQDTDNSSSEHFAGSTGSTTGGSPATGATHTVNANDAQLQPLLQSHHHRRQSHHGSHGTLNGSLADSNSTLDSDYTSQGSLNGNNDQRILLPGAANAAAAAHHGRSGEEKSDDVIGMFTDFMLHVFRIARSYANGMHIRTI